MNWLDTKYISLVSSRLDRFKALGSKGLHKFRCIYCGDSEKNEFKARAYFYVKEREVCFKCHNCGEAKTFRSFLKDFSPDLYKLYLFEYFDTKKETEPDNLFKSEKPKFSKKSLLENFQSIDKVFENNPGRIYLENRKIPENHFKDLFWVPDVEKIYSLLPTYSERELPKKSSAILIPFREGGNLNFVQLRFLDGPIRYLTLEVSGGKKVWGIDRLDPKETNYVFEGAFDAMFCKNSCAVAGADINTAISSFKGGYSLVWDSDYATNPEIFQRLENSVNKGESVVLLDTNLPGKDLNEAVINGFKIEDIPSYLVSRTFSGLAAELELSKIRSPKKKKEKYDCSEKKKSSPFNF